jgi:hypothetical protein
MADANIRTRGTVISIGTTASTASSDTYTVIEDCRSVDGAFGPQWQMADSSTLSDTYTQGIKTVANGGQITLGGLVFEDNADGGLAPGQAALKAAADDDTEPDIYNLKLASPGGAIVYLKVQVSSFTIQFGNNTNLKEFRAQCMVRAAYTTAANP